MEVKIFSSHFRLPEDTSGSGDFFRISEIRPVQPVSNDLEAKTLLGSAVPVRSGYINLPIGGHISTYGITYHSYSHL